MGLPITLSTTSGDWGRAGANNDIGKVSLYDAYGNPIYPQELARGSVNILIRQSAATAAGAVVWMARNINGTRTVVIPRLTLQFSFDGTGAATLMRYEVVKYVNCTATTGTAVTPSIYKTSLSQAISLEAKVADTGITLTGGAVQGGPVWTGTYGRVTPAATAPATVSMPGFHEVIEQQSGMGVIELAQYEVLAIRNGPTNASVIGDSVFGKLSFYEK